MRFLTKHSLIALFYFFLIAILGVLLRLFLIVDIAANYKYIVHTHSHVALLGWVYTALTTLIYKLYLTNSSIEKKYHLLFWCTQITIIGMLVAFPFTGYALFSILFSTLFLFASYVFTWLFIKHTTNDQKKTNSYKCIQISLWYMVLSSIGPWALGYIMSTAGSNSNLYRNAIYFYLHFQYNGWFVMALIGILFFILEQQNILISKKIFNRFYILMNIGIVTTFGISLLWMKPHLSIYSFSFLGALFQLVALYVLANELHVSKQKSVDQNSKLFLMLLRIVGFFFLIKLLLQLLGSIPYFATITTSNIDFVIGYIHWIFLGVVSIALLTFLYYFKLIVLSKRITLLYLIGFILTEGLIFYKGIVIWQKQPIVENYFWYLVIASSILLVAIASILYYQFRRVRR